MSLSPLKWWLAWALHLAHTTAAARGWDPVMRRALQRVLVMLLAEHHEPDRIRVSYFAAAAAEQYINLDFVVEILTTMGIVDDDRPPSLEGWITGKLAALPDPWRRDLHSWGRLLQRRPSIDESPCGWPCESATAGSGRPVGGGAIDASPVEHVFDGGED